MPLRYLNSYYRENNIAEAMRLYEHAYQIGIGYGREGTGNRLGDMYLVSRNLIQAEAYFNKALDVGQHYRFKRRLYAKYGLARVALAKGERDKDRQIAQEVLNDLSRIVTSHRLLDEIRDFLQDLEDIS